MRKINFITIPAAALMMLSIGAGTANAKHQPSNTSQLNQTARKIGGYGYRTTGGIKNVNHPTIVNNIKELRKALKKGPGQYIIARGSFNGNINKHSNKLMTAKKYAKGTKYNFRKYLFAYNPKKTKQEPKGAQENARKISANRQKENVKLKVPNNTTILGTRGNHFKNINLITSGNNIIIRNLNMQAPVDYFPSWDPKDGKLGNWNSQYDAISVKDSKNVWLDHNTLTDGTHSDKEPQKSTYNRQYQQHDGLTDITNGANNVTISNNKYSHHDKAMLIGNSDKRTSDKGKLNTSIFNNTFQDTIQRTPRVRYGHVNIENNYYVNSNHKPYKFSYAYGYGKDAHIKTNHNYFNGGSKSKQMAKHLVSGKQGASLLSNNNYVNNSSIDIKGNNKKIKSSAVKMNIKGALKAKKNDSKTNGATLKINSNTIKRMNESNNHHSKKNNKKSNKITKKVKKIFKELF